MLHQLLGSHGQTLGGKLGVQERDEKLLLRAVALVCVLLCVLLGVLLWAHIWAFVYTFVWAFWWAFVRDFLGAQRAS
jgi:hypothetical protein